MTDDFTHDDGGTHSLAMGETDVTCDIDRDERPSTAVVRAVASVTNTRVTDLDPLYDVVDPDHIDKLFGGQGGGKTPKEGVLTFDFGGCRVTVTREVVLVREQPDEDD